jgi:hypothetical protein
MKTRILFRALLLMTILATATPSVSFAAPANPKTEMTEERARQLTNRLEEIKAMDTKKMTRSERKALRVEVKQIKKEMAASGGVYISIGAIIIIALLLILLL